MVEVEENAVECLCIFYDDSLNEIRRISLNDIVADAGWAAWAVSSDGTVRGYYDQWDGLNLYDLASRTKRQLLNAEDGIKADFLTVNALFFDEKDKRLVFTGQTNADGRTVASWGRIGTGGKGLENHILAYDLGMAVGYGGRKLPVSRPFFSEDGTVFATAALDIYQMEVSVWRTADRSLLYQEVIRDDREKCFTVLKSACSRRQK